MSYSIEEAITRVKESSKVKFDATVEVHINLNLDKNQNVRFTTTLPEGTAKQRKVAVFASENIEEADLQLKEADLPKIKNGEIKPGEDFDVLIAQPQFMSKIAQVAPILGPAGVMPNPKSGTVTENVKETVKDFKSGQIEIRTEPSAPIIHVPIGKVSWKEDRLIKNLDHLLSTLKSNKPQGSKPAWISSAFVTSTMGPSFEITL